RREFPRPSPRSPMQSVSPMRSCARLIGCGRVGEDGASGSVRFLSSPGAVANAVSPEPVGGGGGSATGVGADYVSNIRGMQTPTCAIRVHLADANTVTSVWRSIFCSLYHPPYEPGTKRTGRSALPCRSGRHASWPCAVCGINLREHTQEMIEG